MIGTTNVAGGSPPQESLLQRLARESEAALRLDNDYQTAVQAGDTGRAEALSQRLDTVRRHGTPAQRELARQHNMVQAQLDHSHGRKPKPGEEEKLEARLDSIERKAASLNRRKQALLRQAADDPQEQQVFDKLRQADEELARLDYEAQGVQQALDSFERYRQHEAEEARRKAEEARRAKLAAEVKAKTAKSEELVKAISGKWSDLLEDLSELSEVAQELDAAPPELHAPTLGDTVRRLTQATHGAIIRPDDPRAPRGRLLIQGEVKGF